MPRKIMVIEDDEAIRATFEEFLEMEGYEVSVAANGKLALEMLRGAELLPHAILLDLMMPVMNGVEFREVQVLDPKLSEIPVIVLSANTQIEALKPRLKARAYLRKPSDLNVILETVARVCQ